MTRVQRRFLLALLTVSWLSAFARAQEVAAVISSAPGPYQAAFDSFLKEFGQQVSVYHLPQDKPVIGRGTRVVVAFGGEAAVQSYPKRVTVIVCLAPGLPARSPHGGPFSLIAMKPPAAILLTQLKKLQPQMKRLAVLWNSKSYGGYLFELQRIAAAQGISVVAVRVSEASDIPEALRTQSAKADALWLGPDPRLINPETFQTIKQFSWDNALPFYVPTAGLAAAGAAAAISISTQEMGHQVSELSRQALSGALLPEIVYPEKTVLTINPESAGKAGLKIAPETLGQADKVLP
jgi:hypothetical protein